jgi:hypothetical protein
MATIRTIDHPDLVWGYTARMRQYDTYCWFVTHKRKSKAWKVRHCTKLLRWRG